jgi:polysaccharide chain length determinant protein (PEP-CTERM system associated)
MEEQSLRPSDIKRVLRRRARLALIIAGLCMLGGILIAAVLPNRYQAHTTLLIEPQTISTRLVDSASGEADLSKRLHIMMMQILSRARLSRVIEDLGLYPEMSEEKTREDVIGHMRSQIWIEPVLPEIQPDPKAKDYSVNTFRLYFRHDSPTTVAAVANRLANDFIDEHIRERVQVSGDTAEFIESELTRLAQRIREVNAQIAQVKSENAGSLPENYEANETTQERTLTAMREAARRVAEAEGDAVFYRQQATVVRATEGGSNLAISPAMRAQQLDLQMAELRSRGYTDRHPDIIVMKAELDVLRNRIAGGGEGSLAGTTSVAEQEALALSKRAELRAEAERAEIERLRGELSLVEERLGKTPRVAEQLDGLNREYESLSVSFQDYSNKRLEATVAANMERRQKGEQFRVLEPAFRPSNPVSPNRPLIVVLGVLLGVFLGVGTAVLLEATNNSFHEARGLQENMRIPVLASIPGIVLKSDLAARRRRRFREAIAAAAVSGVVLVASAAGYVYVNAPGLWPGGDDEEPAVTSPPAAAPAASPAAPPAPPPQAALEPVAPARE